MKQQEFVKNQEKKKIPWFKYLSITGGISVLIISMIALAFQIKESSVSDEEVEAAIVELKADYILNQEPGQFIIRFANTNVNPNEILDPEKKSNKEISDFLDKFKIDPIDPELSMYTLSLSDKSTRAIKRVIFNATQEGNVEDIKAIDEFTQKIIENIENKSEVAYIEPNYLAKFAETDPYSTEQWAIDFKEEYGMKIPTDEIKGAEVIVAVLDTGVEYTHADLIANMHTNSNNQLIGKDYVNGDDDPMDDNHHGTGVAGIIAAESNNGIGIRGICQSCKIMPVKVLDSDGNGVYSQIVKGITFACKNNADILNISIEGASNSSAMQDAIEKCGNNTLIVSAAGNGATSELTYPAAYSLAVANTGPDGKKVSDSNYGDWIDIAAPGKRIMTTTINNSYTTFSGTSFSAPNIAGVAGLIKSLYPSLQANEIETILKSTTDELPESPFKIGGLVNATRALSSISQKNPTPTIPEKNETPTKYPSPFLPNPTNTPKSSSSFIDIDSNHQFYEAINYTKQAGIINGYSDGTYKPDNKITRGEFVSILIRGLFSSSEINNCTDNFFPDINNNSETAKYACLAKKNGIINGYSDNTFKPNKEISADEAFKIIALAYIPNQAEAVSSTSSNPFAKFVIALRAENAIPNTIKSLKQEITRGEMAYMIYELSKN